MTPETPDDLEAMELETSPPPPVRPVTAAPAAAPAALPGRFEPLNLSRRPFLNTRPVVRVSLLLWLLGLALLAGNISLFWSYRERSADKRAQIARGEAEIDRQQAASRQLQSQLDNFDLAQENRRVDFLNHKIQQRTFSWSTLLDRIAERLPNDMRLNRLAPLTGDKTEKEFQRTRQNRRGSQAGDEVPLLITGETRKGEALLSFLDSLYKAPFSYPDLTREETEEGGQLVKFELTVQYRPGPATAAIPATSPGAAAGPQPKIEELPAPAPSATSSTAIAAPGAAATSPPTIAQRPGAQRPPAPKPPGGRP